MSFFYLSPANGDMPIHLLETIINKRLEYLKTIIKGESIVYSEYVIEGSVYDNVGHFMLCILTILCENNGLLQFLLQAEKELFKHRLESLSVHDMRNFAKKLLKNIKKLEYIPKCLEPLNILVQHLMLKELAQHVCNTLHPGNCSMHTITIHFRHCLSFVAKRQIELKNGFASIPCSKWKQYLISIFASNLKSRLQNTNLGMLKNDPRMIHLLEKMKTENLPFKENSNDCNILLGGEVDNFANYFPPCMLNLHKKLRKNHRLSHAQRFYYSLFLKDIGMPVNEAIDFWRMEYQQSPINSHTCCHHWEKDEKKYLYGIRHMYGLEGARKNYTSVGCHRIQSDISCSEGGCPFKSFDNAKMIQILNTKCTDPLLSKLNELQMKFQYTSACIMFLQEKYSMYEFDCDNIHFNFTPIKFYNVAVKGASVN